MTEKKITKVKKEDKAQIKTQSVLISPRMTEKAVLGQEKRNVYVFNVERSATKKQVSASVKAVYKVTPLKVNLTQVASKTKFFRGRMGTRSGGKKAYIYLKKGDKIDVA